MGRSVVPVLLNSGRIIVMLLSGLLVQVGICIMNRSCKENGLVR